jgi:type VI secretion system protein ImpG
VPGDDGTEVLLSFVDLGFKPERPGSETVSVETICTNRDLPGKLPFGRGEGDFQLEGPGVFSAIRCLKKPSAAIRPALGRGAHWRLLSHLSLNYLSLVEREGDGPDALREILKLYDMSDSPVTRQQIAGVSKVSSRRVARMLARPQPSFARGLEVTLELDESQFVGSGAFLFGQILERFLGLYTSINSFTQVVLTSQQRDGIMRRWPPRTGEQLVL